MKMLDFEHYGFSFATNSKLYATKSKHTIIIRLYAQYQKHLQQEQMLFFISECSFGLSK